MPTQQLTVRANSAAGAERVARRIFVIRGQKVMLANHLAELYQVRTKAFNQAVKRGRGRFPVDFMFQLTVEEAHSLRSQIVTSNNGRGGSRYRPFAFTQEGVAMLSSVLRSPRAVQVNIAIMRAFVAMREMAVNYTNLVHKLEQLEKRSDGHDADIKLVFDSLRKLLRRSAPPTPPKRPIGFVGS